MIQNYFTPPDTFQTERLLLKKTTLDDAPALLEIWSNEEVAKFMNIERFKSVSQAEEMIRVIEEEKSACRYTIFNHQTVIGSIGINEISVQDASFEIGYELAKNFWRQGFMSEALTAFLEILAKNSAFQAATAKVLPENVASISLLKKLGFQEFQQIQEFDLFNHGLCDISIFKRNLSI
ncbi:GNAT family N-acetyltransferase [Listeria costaricensis]|uniref:GNAT family N-acetyltransferase n=1 Tax=Listeria costaricensis TaxID=2026604 RepID=UPI000C07BBF3|nr:GNAT family N-acetyltransferase [Listeria costaricensis]